MNRKILCLIFITFFFTQASIAQKVMYLDENQNEITKTDFIKKCEQYIFYCLDYKTDSLQIYKIHERYKFNKTTPETYNNIRLSLSKIRKTDIPKDKTLVINYVDTLWNYQAYLKHYEFVKHNKDTSSIRINRRRYIHEHSKKSFKEYKKSAKIRMDRTAKCTKKLERKSNTMVTHIYNVDLPKKFNYENIEWFKDPGLFKTNYFDMVYKAKFMVIKPNGEYFLSATYYNYDRLIKLLKKDNWNAFKSDLKQSHLDKYQNGFGMFKKLNPIDLLICF